MSRTYRKPKEYYYWKNADAYADWKNDGRWLHLRWKVSGNWEYVTREYARNEAKERYNTWGRDGATHRGSRCKEFSDLCARDLRNANKVYIARGKWDDEMPPDRKNGKKFIWAVW